VEGRPEELLRELTIMSTEGAREFIAHTLAELIANVLQMPADRLAFDRKLEEYGLDSLMAAELHVSLRAQFELDIPPMEFLRSGGTIADMTELIMLRLGVVSTSA